MRLKRSAGVAVALLTIMGLAEVTRGDSRELPRPFEVKSPNGRWLAHFTPRTPEAPAVVAVARPEADAGSWTLPLPDTTAPLDAYVTSDGRRVITLDNHGSAGQGDHVVAIYGPGGLLRQYSLEAILGHDGAGVTFAHPDVTHTTSSRWWRSGAEVLHERPDGSRVFGIWLAATHAWVVFDLTTGDRLEADPDLLRSLNDILRARAIAQLHPGSAPESAPRLHGPIWPLEALAHQRRPRDRPYLERALASPLFRPMVQTRSSDAGDAEWHVSESPLRREADRLLADWDGTAVARDSHGEPVGRHLGAVRGEVRLTRKPGKAGVIHVMLVPEDAVLTPGTPLPVQRVDIDLSWQSVSGKDLSFRLGTVTPGTYRVVALWTHRPTNPTFALYEVAPDEWMSVGPLIEVRAGAVTQVPAFGSGRRASPVANPLTADASATP